MMYHTPQRGFTLLVSVILASVALSLGLALLDIAYKQVVLASSARQSQSAFYRADAVLECALYWDQQHDVFNYSDTAASIECAELDPIGVTFDDSDDAAHVRAFEVPCAEGGTAGQVVITKESDASTIIYASGFNTCDAENPRRIERGLKVIY